METHEFFKEENSVMISDKLGVLRLRQLRIFLKFISNIEYERKMDPKQLQSGEGKQYEQIDFQTVWSIWFYGNMD